MVCKKLTNLSINLSVAFNRLIADILCLVFSLIYIIIYSNTTKFLQDLNSV